MNDCIKREDAIHGLWRALYAYQDEMERKFQTDPDVKFDDWFIHRIFVQDVHAKCLEEICDNIPSADVVERRRGEWLNMDGNKVEMENGCPNTSCWCSECGEWLTASDEYSVYGYFCPNCGADMRGTSND